ncbi:phosphate/phosphite/phosphonate ABC transporter substrate-binding protein [Limnobaculum xujianqingii]|nr:phosphate/phosphite/phosphonate ABC transporter substrate-binding protein [Limnobaculum xujianqingii]
MTKMTTRILFYWLTAQMILAAGLLFSSAMAADCSNRGDLDDRYCDENRDMVADTPTDPKELKNPGTLVFSYTPVEDPAVYKDAFADFQKYLSDKTGKKVIYYSVHSNSAQVEAMRSGRLHIAGFSTGPTGYAVNLAGYVPIAVKGTEKEFQGYNLIVLVKADSPYKTMDDLKGKVVAHTSVSSNSGNLAPRALFPKIGITPDEDYKVVYSGKHDQSVMGVLSGDYDAAPVASDVYERMVEAGRVKAKDFRTIYTSARFPTSAFGYAYDLDPELVAKIKAAFASYRFPPEMQETFGGADRFYPINYKDDWQVVRDIAFATGTAYSKNGLQQLAEKEAADAAKKRQAESAGAKAQ